MFVCAFGGEGVCLCVGMCGGVCFCGGGEEGAGDLECITSNATLTYFSSRTCIRKNRATTTVDNSMLCFNILDQILLLLIFLVYAERFCLNVDVPLFDKVKQIYLKTSYQIKD